MAYLAPHHTDTIFRIPDEMNRGTDVVNTKALEKHLLPSG